ncbi:unnamed protein product [Eruca vesicaria subsp. sativa]|uniref:Uncharacterized protein n=1 Tax=Eruca vesicaria subsp. sativa TaxID=29727 RepID=A0ABC8IM44_ERUVS|nr:unnamed protein product [Eruca vesicaria subsp. sativa]
MKAASSAVFKKQIHNEEEEEEEVCNVFDGEITYVKRGNRENLHDNIYVYIP